MFKYYKPLKKILKPKKILSKKSYILYFYRLSNLKIFINLDILNHSWYAIAHKNSPIIFYLWYVKLEKKAINVENVQGSG